MEFGLIGEKLPHSFSLEVHNLIGDYNYILKEIEKDNLKDFILTKDYKALNITIPYKKEVVKFLDEISPNAKKMGAVNTIVNKNGKLYGYNTDYLGAKALINYNKIKIKGKKVIILGTGGTAQTLYHVVKDLKAKEIIKVSRNPKNDEISYESLVNHYGDCQIIINTTPVGMYPKIENLIIDLKPFKNLECVMDMIYNPYNTLILQQAKNMNIKGVNGLYMLVAQAVHAYGLFFSKPINTKIIEKIYKQILLSKINLILIGMPSCGKTTIGKELSIKLNKPFIDSDSLIEQDQKTTIPKIFEEKGESYFREVEKQIINSIKNEVGAIISVGGGAILKEENIKNLSYNGKLIFLDRSLKNLMPTGDRPLSSDFENLKKRYNERYDIYLKSCDIKVDGDKEIKRVVKSILKEFDL